MCAYVYSSRPRALAAFPGHLDMVTTVDTTVTTGPQGSLASSLFTLYTHWLTQRSIRPVTSGVTLC